MKTLYYYFKWLFKQINFKFESIYLVFIATICFITGIIMNVAGLTIHSEIDPVTHQFRVWRDEHWAVLGDKFLFAGLALYGVYLF